MSIASRYYNPDGCVHAVAVACTRSDGHWLLIRRSRHVGAPLAVAFPGGALEAAETQADAVIREMHEELGVEVEPTSCFWCHRFDARPLVLWGWRASLRSEVLLPNPREVDEVLWLTATEATGHPDRTAQMESFFAALLRHVSAN